jgi:hypothetical protein
MRSHPNSSTFTRLILSLLGVFFLLVQGSPPARAASEAQGTSGTIFQLSISQAENEICVGQSVRVAIQWGPNTRYSENGGQAPLSPLTGPSRIALQASLGRFYPESAPPGGAVSGTTTVTYTAEKEGNEKIFAVAWTGGESDAIASDTFKVKACEYFYTLNAQFDLAITSEDLSYHTRYTVKARGTLTPPDPNEPLHLEARNNYVTMNATMVSWSSSKCVLFTWEPGTGMGEVDARADPGPMGVGMQLQIAPPRDLAWNADLSFACNGDPVTVAGVYPVSSGDPWVSAFFPDGTGTQTVVLDMFEIPYNKLLGAEGISVSYTAKLTLERKDPK